MFRVYREEMGNSIMERYLSAAGGQVPEHPFSLFYIHKYIWYSSQRRVTFVYIIHLWNQLREQNLLKNIK